MSQPSRSLLPTSLTAGPDAPGSTRALVIVSAEAPIVVDQGPLDLVEPGGIRRRPAAHDHPPTRGRSQGQTGDNARLSGVLDIIPARSDVLLDLLRANSLWPLLSGLACCAIEMMSAATSRNDMDRFSMFPFRASPRQADVLIVAGTLTTKMAGPLLRLFAAAVHPHPTLAEAVGEAAMAVAGRSINA